MAHPIATGIVLSLLAVACGHAPAASTACAGADCPEDCLNGVDDDLDGRRDCLDRDCAAQCPEDCVNGVDDNEDWLVDCDDDGCSSTCDFDGDGWLAGSVGGDDCDDADASVHPGGEERYYDGLDNDCDPATVDDDQDGDGWAVAADCDDTQGASWPGAPERCGDGVTNDCAVPAPPREACFGERSLGTADYVLDGSEADSWAGWAVAGVGDADSDGGVEIVIGAPGLGPFTAGGAYRVSWPLPRASDLRTIGCEVLGVGESDSAGARVEPLGEFDRIAGEDAGISAPFGNVPDRSGSVYALGAQCTPGPLSGSAIEISGFSGNDLGAAFAISGDQNRDGDPDLAVGMPGYANETGAVVLFAGPLAGSLTPDDGYAILVTEHDGSGTGTVVQAAGDVDGDGAYDLLIGAPLLDANGSDSGAVYVLTDVPIGESRLDDTLTLTFGDPGDQFGFSAPRRPGDFDGDGYDDVVSSAPFVDLQGPDVGLITIIDLQTEPPTPVAILDGKAPGDTFGFAVTALDDVDGDGLQDLAVGAPGADVGGLADAGAVYVYFGPYAGTMGVDAAGVTLLGEAAYDYAGMAVSRTGDANGDGLDDLLIGAPYHDGLLPEAGRVYLFTFEL